MTRHLRIIPALMVIFTVILAGVAVVGTPQAQAAAPVDRLEDLQITTVTSSGIMPRLAEATGPGCSWRKVSRVATAVYGTAWSVSLRGDWCWRNGKVRSVSWSKSFFNGQQILNNWSWIGWVNTVTGGGVGEAVVYRRTKGHFRTCFIISLGTICDDAFPWTALTLRGDGTAAADSGTG